MSLQTLDDLFLHELKDILHAEKQLLKALPRLSKAAQTPALKTAFTEHRDETEGQIERLEQVFEELDKPSRAKRCVGMEGLVEEGTELIEEKPEAEILDAGLIGCAQKVEHYEIAAYGTLVAMAKQLGMSKAAKLLEQNLNEEKKADAKLTMLAEKLNGKKMNGRKAA